MRRALGALSILCSVTACNAGSAVAPSVADAVGTRSPALVRVTIDRKVAELDGPVLVVQHGFLRVKRGELAHAVFEGRGFRIEAEGIELGVLGPGTCEPCEPGSTLSPASFFGGSFLGNGPAMVDEEYFERLFYGGSIDLTGEPVTVSKGRLQGVWVAPIQLSAFLQGYLNSALIPDPPEPSLEVELSGHGIMKATFTRAGDLWFWEEIEYTFLPRAN